MKTNCVLANITSEGGLQLTRLLMIAGDSDSCESIVEREEESVDLAR